jgi:uncharacterized protein (DUF736 family)
MATTISDLVQAMLNSEFNTDSKSVIYKPVVNTDLTPTCRIADTENLPKNRIKVETVSISESWLRLKINEKADEYIDKLFSETFATDKKNKD